MADDKTIHDGRDAAKVDANDRNEVEALHQQWKQFSHSQILEAIKEYGPLRKDIETYLTNQAGVM